LLLTLPPLSRPAISSKDTFSPWKQAAICTLLLVPVLVWLWIWPYSGDGDSVLHYLAARTVWVDPSSILGSWSRPLHKLLIIVPAIGGIVPARICQALICMALAWQTISLARQLQIPNALLAGPLLVFQPYVFALASDTMTEIPMALAIVIAVRLWIADRRAWSCAVASLLPLLRPEGFFFIAMWGLMLLLPTRRSKGGALLGLLTPVLRDSEEPDSSSLESGSSDYSRTTAGEKIRCLALSYLFPASLLSIGMIAWILACWYFTGYPLYFIRIWSWPMESYAAYHAGPIYHYLIRWPNYCGAVLLLPFVIGIVPSLRRRHIALIWSVWLLVFVLHSLLFWLHKFASVGLLRILACTAPMTAIICLEGFNAIGQWLAARGYSLLARQRLAGIAVVLALGWAMISYSINGERYHCFGYRALAREMTNRHLLDDYQRQLSSDNLTAPRLIAGDKMFLAALGLNAEPRHYADSAMDGPTEFKRLADEPLGTIGAWDSEQAVVWHTVRIEDFADLGYTILYEYDQTVPDLGHLFVHGSLLSPQRFVIIRKDKPARKMTLTGT
jgi:hypothetical protein